jgi:nucleoside-diphosphate-sugar epimerase
VRILITGNMGYVGPVVATHLRRRFPDAELIGFDSGYFSGCLTTNQGLPETVLDAQYFGDIREFPPLLLSGTEAVVHLAAISNDPMGDRFAAATEEINQTASLRLAALARDAGVRTFCFASSCSVYGYAEDGPPRAESDPLRPLTVYARSKIKTEEGLHRSNSGDMTVSCLRFATACGMSPRLRLDLVLNDFVACALASAEITVLSDGTPWRPLIEVRDMARAIEWAIGRAPEQGGQVLSLNVGSDDWNLQVKDLADAVMHQVPGTRVSINSASPPDNRSYRVDFSLFRRLAPLHQPQVSLAQAVCDLRDGLQAIGFADERFREGPCMRLRVLDRLLASSRLRRDLRWSAQ